MSEDILCLYSSITYCHGPFTLKQVKGFRTKLVLQTLYTSFSFFSAVLLQGFHHCTSVIPHTPIYRAFKLTNSYLQIYLVKPWLISTVFKPTLQLFKDKTLEYLKILNSKNNKKRENKILLISFFDPKTLFSRKVDTCTYLQLLFSGLIPDGEVQYTNILCQYCFEAVSTSQILYISTLIPVNSHAVSCLLNTVP